MFIYPTGLLMLILFDSTQTVFLLVLYVCSQLVGYAIRLQARIALLRERARYSYLLTSLQKLHTQGYRYYLFLINFNLSYKPL